MARRTLLKVSVCVFVLLGLSSWACAGIAWQGVNSPVIFIPPTKLPQSMPSFSAATPFQSIFNTCIQKPGHTCVWRVRNQGQPFFPVNRGFGLIRDTAQMLNTGPIFTPATVWGFWDSPTTIGIDDTVRVFEVFTGVDTSQTVQTMNFYNLVSVQGYPGLTAGMFPQGVVNVPLALALGPNLTVLSDTIIGDLTGTSYSVNLIGTDFQSLQSLILSLNPNFALDVSTLPPFAGQTGNIVLGYADIPAKDVILYNAEVLPEPNSLLLVGTGVLGFGIALKKRLSS